MSLMQFYILSILAKAMVRQTIFISRYLQNKDKRLNSDNPHISCEIRHRESLP